MDDLKMESNKDGMELSSEPLATKPSIIELCRLCANTDNQLIPIFRGEGLEHNISFKIEKHLPVVKVTESDKLPLQICYQCASTLIAWHNLYEGCKTADKRLRDILASEEKLSQDDDTFENFDDDYHDDYEDHSQTYPECTLSDPVDDTKNDMKNTSAADVKSVCDPPVFLETENNVTDARCTARVAKKRRILTTKTRMPSSVKEERAKIVKSKKINLLIAAPSNKKTSEFDPMECTNDTRVKKAVEDFNTTAGNQHRTRTSFQVQFKRNLAAASKPKRSEKIDELKSETSNKSTDVKEPGLIECSPCSFVADQETQLQQNHRAKSHSSSAAQSATVHTCEHCGYSCLRKYDLQRHITSRHPEGIYSVEGGELICALCDKTYTKKSSLLKHILKLHFTKRGEQCSVKWRRGCYCNVCGRGFESQNEMMAHRHVLHADLEPIKWYQFRTCFGKLKLCETCKRYYRDGKFLNEHDCVKREGQQTIEKINQVSASRPNFKCDICSLCFLWKWSYRQHREAMHPEADLLNWDTMDTVVVPFYCESCYLGFEDESGIGDHQCVKTDTLMPKLHTCECGSSYRRRADYLKHRRCKHSEANLSITDADNKRKTEIQCPYCEETALTRNSILQHVKQVHHTQIETPFICLPCNKLFKRKITLDTHKEIYHPKEENVQETNEILKAAEILLNGERAYHCNICNRNMFSETRFVAHYRLHFVEKKFTCDLCGKQTRTKHQLNSHIKSIHLNIRNHECDICGKSFHARQSCEEHRRIHTGERPFSCEICGKTFIAMNALLTHQKFHNDFYAHVCSMCPKKFKVRRSLINHIRTHTGERPYKCEICSKTFNNSSRFSYHKKVTHSEARPFTCETCGSCFKANKFLLRHMKLHTIREHIQFRRRNNPAYFASLNNEKNMISSKKEEKDINKVDFVTAGKTEATVFMAAVYNMEGVCND